MRTLISIFLTVLLWAGSAGAFPPGFVAGMGGSADNGCLAATYLLYWDGDHTGGNTTACVANGSTTRTGTNNGDLGTFADDSGTIFVSDATNERLTFALTSTDYSVANTDGWTICAEFKTGALSNSVEIAGWIASTDITRNYGIMYSASNARPIAAWRGSNIYTAQTHTLAYAVDGTYNSVCVSFKYGEAGNDTAVSLNGGATWEEGDKDMTVWDAAENTYYIGDWGVGASGGAVSIRKTAIIPGYKQVDLW